jgi:kremen protein
MLSRTVFALLAVAFAATACEIPDGPPLSNTITQGFGVAIQNPEFPVIHNRFLNLYEAGGGDRHLYLNPVGAYAFDITLQSGVITWQGIRAVINGEVCLPGFMTYLEEERERTDTLDGSISSATTPPSCS